MFEKIATCNFTHVSDSFFAIAESNLAKYSFSSAAIITLGSDVCYVTSLFPPYISVFPHPCRDVPEPDVFWTALKPAAVQLEAQV